jgi:hypothetical protein
MRPSFWGSSIYSDPNFSAKNIFRIALLCTAIAIALIWSFREMLDRHEGTGAWVQAVGAIVIIFATAVIASRSARDAHERDLKARQELWLSIATLAGNCLNAIDTLLQNYSTGDARDPRGTFLRSYAPTDFDVPIDGLSAIPLHHVGNANLITSVLELRGIMGRIKKHLDDVAPNPLFSPSVEMIRNQRTPAFNAVASILDRRRLPC